jgi:hypothetical protein
MRTRIRKMLDFWAKAPQAKVTRNAGPEAFRMYLELVTVSASEEEVK